MEKITSGFDLLERRTNDTAIILKKKGDDKEYVLLGGSKNYVTATEISKIAMYTEFDIIEIGIGNIEDYKIINVSDLVKQPDEIKIFFDMEFTGLRQRTTPISIGCVTETGKKFYAEFNDFDRSQCDRWIEDNVLSHLELKRHTYITKLDITSIHRNTTECTGTRWYVADQFKLWLQSVSDGRPIQFVSDVCHYDFVLLISMFGDAFALNDYNISPVCYDINNDIAKEYHVPVKNAFDICREDIVRQEIQYNLKEIKKHNALFDAQVIRLIYDKIVGNKKCY